jgi:hypothetical protein
MTRRTEQWVLRVPCPICGSPRGQRCTTLAGKPRGRPHNHRWAAAGQAGRETAGRDTTRRQVALKRQADAILRKVTAPPTSAGPIESCPRCKAFIAKPANQRRRVHDGLPVLLAFYVCERCGWCERRVVT